MSNQNDTDIDDIEQALEDAFLAGFRSTGEGHNGEYVAWADVMPWDDEFRNTEQFRTRYEEWRDGYTLNQEDSD